MRPLCTPVLVPSVPTAQAVPPGTTATAARLLFLSSALAAKAVPMPAVAVSTATAADAAASDRIGRDDIVSLFNIPTLVSEPPHRRLSNRCSFPRCRVAPPLTLGV